MLYLALFVVVVKNTMETRQMLRQEYNILRSNEVRQLLEAIKLKLAMMNKFMLISCFYFLYELIINGLIPTFNQTNNDLDPYQNVV